MFGQSGFVWQPDALARDLRLSGLDEQSESRVVTIDTTRDSRNIGCSPLRTEIEIGPAETHCLEVICDMTLMPELTTLTAPMLKLGELRKMRAGGSQSLEQRP